MAKFEDELLLKDSASDKLDKIAGKMSGLSSKGEKLKNVFSKISGGLGTAGKSAASLAGKLAKVGLSAAGISVTSISALALACSQAARDAEELNATMDLLTGSSEKSKKVFDDLDKEVGLFSRNTLRDLSVQMLDNGISTEKLIPTLRMLEGFSMGSADNLQKLTNELTKVSSTGRVTAQSLKALSAIGIDGQKEMQKQLGVTPKLFHKLLSAGRITFTDYEKLLTRVYNITDKYNQSMEKMANTINGKFDIVHNKLGIVGDRLKESLGKIALPYLEKIATKMSEWADKLNNLPIEKVENLKEVLNAVKVIFEGIWFVIEKIVDALGGLYNVAKKVSEVVTGKFLDWFSDDIKTPKIIPMNSGETANEYLNRIGKSSSSLSAITNAISSGASQANGNTTNMTNTFNINGTVREEADIGRIGRAIADSLEMKFNNMGVAF